MQAMRRICLFITGLSLTTFAVWRLLPAALPPRPQPTSPVATAHYGQVPLSFEANHGQAKQPVKYLARGTNATLYLTAQEAALEVRSSQPTTDHQPPTTALVKMKLLGANAQPQMRGVAELPGKSNYFSGSDPQAWQTNIPTYQRVKYSEVYDGIDLVYYGNQQQLEYDFIVQPGADPQAIKFNFEGAEAIALNAAGELVLHTTAGEIKQHKPVLYQEVQGARKEIAGNYMLKGEEVGFVVGAYDPSQPLVIDPIISWASYVGGQPSASASAITADKSGNVYLVVWDGPNPTAGAYASSSGYSVLKVNPSGTAVVWTARIGTSSFDRAYGIALDQDNNVYLTGAAASSTYPTTPGAFQTAYGLTCGGCRNAFVTKLSADGSRLLYSTFVGGTAGYQSNPGASNGVGIAVDRQGQAYITGSTSFIDFPTTSEAFQPQLKLPPRNKPVRDAFVTKLNATGTALLYSTYLGDPGNGDEGKAIAVDSQDNAFVTGITGNGFDDGGPRIDPFPTTPGAYVTTDSGSLPSYVFLTKLNPTGSALGYSTIIGAASGSTETICLTVDTMGNAYLAGGVRSRTFPTTPNAYRKAFSQSSEDSVEAFVTKINPSGSALVYSTFLGGSKVDRVMGLSVDAQGNATVAGLTNSPDFPQTDGQQPLPHAVGFLTRLNNTGSGIYYSTLHVSGPFEGLAAVGNGSYYAFGGVRDEFAPTSGAFQTTFSPHFVTKLSIPNWATTVSAASYEGSPLASEAIVSAFGTGLATTTKSAFTLPLPTILGGTTVKVRDSIGTERDALLFFVSPTQVNFQLPPGTANGTATITITGEDSSVTISQVQIVNVAPSLFSADTTGRGLAAAQVQRAGAAMVEPAVRFDPIRGQIVAVPIDLGGVNDEVYLVLYGTGVRLRSSLSNVMATIGGVNAVVSYAGSQNGFVGLDQVNILIPRSLIGRGIVDVALNVDGKAANIVKVSIK